MILVGFIGLLIIGSVIGLVVYLCVSGGEDL